MIVPAVPPFYWGRFAPAYKALKHTVGHRMVPRPPDRLFARDEQDFYLAFARALGYPDDAGPCRNCRSAPAKARRASACRRVVLAPGCKTGTMTAKRWPHFEALAMRFADVVVVGTTDDLRHHDGRPMQFAAHVRSLVDRLSLRETAELMAAVGGGRRQRQRAVARGGGRWCCHPDAVWPDR